MATFCSKCGTAAIADTQQFCMSCGTNLHGSQTTMDSTQPVNRPNVGNPTNANQPPKNWLLESILASLFCCLPLGIVGIVHAIKVESRFYAGDIEAANKASKEAKRWTIITAITGGVLGFIYGVIMLIGLLSES
jgi:Interferon-induced transmembrane protein